MKVCEYPKNSMNSFKEKKATHGARKHAWRTQAAWANEQTKKRLYCQAQFQLVVAVAIELS